MKRIALVYIGPINGLTDYIRKEWENGNQGNSGSSSGVDDRD